jgi:sulfite reductase (ferredoxin)
MQRLQIDKLEETLEPLFIYFKRDRKEGEGFGDFCDRKGNEDLRQFVAAYVPDADETDKSDTASMRKDRRHRITLSPSTYEQIKQAATNEQKTMKEVVESAIAKYLAGE